MQDPECLAWLAARDLDVVSRPVPLSQRTDAILQPSLNMALAELTLRNGRPIVVQIGAHDGNSGDPLVDFLQSGRTRAILLEPQPDPFALLQARHAHKTDVICVNAAVAERDGHCPLFVVNGTEAGDPWWCGQIASLSREHLLRHAEWITNLADRIRTIDVSTISPESLLRDYAGDHIDALVVDAEGADWQIVKLFLDRHVRPDVLFFEWRHLDRHTVVTAVKILADLGYRMEFVDADLIATNFRQ